MGKFKSIDANTVECNGVQFTCKKPLGVVAAGNFLDKRLHWYDPCYKSTTSFKSTGHLIIELDRYGPFTGASLNMYQVECNADEKLDGLSLGTWSGSHIWIRDCTYAN